MHVITRVPEQVNIAWPIRHQSSGSHEITGTVYHRQSRAERERKDTIEIGDDKLVDHDIKRIRLGVELLEHWSDVLHLPDFELRNVEVKCTSRGSRLVHLQQGLVVATIENNGQSAQPGDQFTQ